MAPRRSGPRPGRSGTREAILAAARRQFAAQGYDRTSMRGVAAEAGVDQALVAHFVGSKQGLLVEVVRLPFEPGEVRALLLEGDRDTLGVVRAAASEPEAARMLREFLRGELWAPLAGQLGVEDSELRVTLAGSQIVGMVMARHVVAVEPLAALSGDELATLLAPTLQRYLAGELAPSER